MSHPIPRTAGALVLALALASLTACGGGSSSTGATASTSSPATSSGAGSSAATESLTATEADFTIALDRDGLTAGTYEITVNNDGRATHDLVVEQNGADVASTDSIAPGDTATLTVTLDPGEYVFYCSIGNHRAMGMELTVQVS